ncbi:LPS export ABC transporter periplasmic protein LptC [Vibrio sp. 10N.286.49.B3]|uniref:LPS export ABC transporter periplasmic protein LptC n=1 Tax=Vibrio sp. 10N.286.49.B3 TaxID=1880855 RepID=UPI000C83B6E6|nr:LPS export ABC transporter periplasmic protein LptC [Vibrio sp. 10N.286.49.B3]PMH42534.1 LPS export ABC transporter periplasmic protein LptC [Vibrio sp. 10N.286.49.B3]
MSLSRILYVLLFFIASWAAYYLYDNENSDVVQISANQELPMFSGKGLNNTSFNSNGMRSYVITSDSLDHYASSGETIFQYPILSIYQDGQNIEWQISSHRAVLDDNQVLTLYDNVLANNLLPDSSFNTMTTDKLEIELTSRNFSTTTPVTLVGPQFTTTGQAMMGNFKDNVSTLFNKVQGKYETLTP